MQIHRGNQDCNMKSPEYRVLKFFTDAIYKSNSMFIIRNNVFFFLCTAYIKAMREREVYDVRNLEQFTHWRRILHKLKPSYNTVSAI